MFQYVVAVLFAVQLKKILKDRFAFLLEETTLDDGLRVKHGAAEAFEASLGVGSTIDDAAYLGPPRGPGTHDAGLEGDVECTVGEVFGVEIIGGSRES
jgi:hypothetical protein